VVHFTSRTHEWVVEGDITAAAAYSANRSTAAPGAPERAENLIHGSDQQSCPPCRPTVMITGHVPAVRVPPDHATSRVVAAAIPA
jgi:hypothetical protein